MAQKVTLIVIVSMIMCSIAHGFTLTFDEVESGTDLFSSSYYRDNYRVNFGLFQAIDHTSSTWGTPHSGTNVLVMTEASSLGGQILFGYYTSAWADIDDIASIGAYFSTNNNALVRVTAYAFPEGGGSAFAVASTVIGTLGESWNNRYVEISASQPFYALEFTGVNSTNDLLNFCADDMTVTPVPEPSSLLALFIGFAGIGRIALKRRNI